MDSQKNSPSSSFHLSAPSSLSAPRERHMKRLKHRRKRLDVYTSHTEDTCLSCLVLWVFLPLSHSQPSRYCLFYWSNALFLSNTNIVLLEVARKLANLTMSKACVPFTTGLPWLFPHRFVHFIQCILQLTNILTL